MKVDIGARYVARPSQFSRRDAAGGYSHTLPPMTEVDERLQRALLPPPPIDEGHFGDRLVFAVALITLAAAIALFAGRLAWLYLLP